jgi:hypothetical protein
MPAGTGEQSTGAPGKTSDAQPAQENFAPSLQEIVGKIDPRKHGQRSSIYILVGPTVPDYEIDITFVPTMIHLKRNANDSVEWRLGGAQSFTLEFVDESPFEKTTFDSRNNVGTVRADAVYGRYRYNLTSLTTLKGNTIKYGQPPKYCPEIIIQR